MEKNEAQKDPQGIDLPKDSAAAPTAAMKKPFIEPEISVPVNVLEATTFLQAVDSGATN